MLHCSKLLASLYAPNLSSIHSSLLFPLSSYLTNSFNLFEGWETVGNMKETACFGCQLSLVSSQLGVSFGFFGFLSFQMVNFLIDFDFWFVSSDPEVDCGMIVECAEMFARSEYMFLSEIDLSVVHPGYYVNGKWKGRSSSMVTSVNPVDNEVQILFHWSFVFWNLIQNPRN